MGIILYLAALWLVLCLGALDKDAKFLSLSTYIITPMLVVIWTVQALSPSTESAESGGKFAAQAAIGAIFGLVYCILYTEKLRAEKKYPLAAGISAVCVSTGFAILFFGVVKHLN